MSGVGTELKNFFAKYGIYDSAGCGCAVLAKQYDENGVAWCEERFDEIVETLRENARKRFHVPAPRFVVRRILQKAIRDAKTAQEL
jgi:hypothetical protein